MKGGVKSPEELQRRVRTAQERLSSVERSLEQALGRLDQAERAEKQMISRTLQTALDEVTRARAELVAIVPPDDLTQ